MKLARKNWRWLTLLEVILALSLTTLLLSGIYGAMHLFYRGVTTTRASVERDQFSTNCVAAGLGRSPFRSPLHASRYQRTQRCSNGGLADAAAALGAATGSGTGSSSSPSTGSSGSSSNGASGSNSGSTGGSTSSESSTETTDTTTAPAIPGVYGNSTFLQIDICRLPRPDEIAANASGDHRRAKFVR